MTIEKHPSVFSYITAAALVLLAVPYSYMYYMKLIDGYGFIFGNILSFLIAIGLFVSAIGFVIKKKPVKIIGLALPLLLKCYDFFTFLPYLSFDHFSVVLRYLLPLLLYVLLIITVAEDNKGVGIAAAIVSVVSGFRTIISDWLPYVGHGGTITWNLWIEMILPIVISVVVIFTLVKKEKTKTQSVSMTTDSISSTDKLLKLKSLLDSGAITQEEFDEKKKEILGL